MPTVVINSFPTNITSDPFNVNVTVTGAKSGTNYLRVELYKDGSNDYFGETFNGKDWNSDSIGEDYSPIVIKSATTSATIQGRIGDPTNGQYSGSGIYDLKIKRYTASGNAASDAEDAVQVQINYNLATLTPAAIPTSNSHMALTQTLIPATVLDTPKIITTSSPEVLAQPTPEATAGGLKSYEDPQSFPIFPAFIFATGLFFVGIVLLKAYTKFNVSKRKKAS
jgi:hypothetical protein